jgi:hypothetical protein
MLLLFGVILVFIYSISDDGIPIFQTWKIIITIFYIHAITFQISCVGDMTTREIYAVHAVMRKIYTSKPHEDNLACLDVNLDVIKYNCGLFTFDWSLIKMVTLFILFH